MVSDDFSELRKTAQHIFELVIYMHHWLAPCSTDLLDVRDDGSLGLDVQQLDLLDHLLLTLTLTHTKQEIKITQTHLNQIMVVNVSLCCHHIGVKQNRTMGNVV